MPLDIDLLFDRLRAIDKAYLSHSRYNSEYPSAAADPIRSIDYEADQIFSQYTTTDQNLVSGENGLYKTIRELAKDANSKYFDFLASLAQNTLLQMVGNAFNVQDNTIEESLRRLIDEMVAQGKTVTKSSVTITATLNSSNFGNGAIVITKADRYNPGKDVENAFSETIDIKVSSQGTFITPSKILLTGDSERDYFEFEWPQGSGLNKEIDAALPQSPDNRINNASFDSWVGGAPSNWTVISGTSPTDYDVESGVTQVWYAGGQALKIKAAGSVDVILKQAVTTGYQPNAAYFIGMWLRRLGTPTATNDITLSLVDANDNVITDATGNNIAVTVSYGDINLVDTTYTLFGSIFFTSSKAVDSANIKIRAKTVGTGNAVFVDGVFMIPAIELYKGGPHILIVQGRNPFVKGDKGLITVSNTRSKWQTRFERFFKMTSSFGLLLPSAVTGNIND